MWYIQENVWINFALINLTTEVEKNNLGRPSFCSDKRNEHKCKMHMYKRWVKEIFVCENKVGKQFSLGGAGNWTKTNGQVLCNQPVLLGLKQIDHAWAV